MMCGKETNYQLEVWKLSNAVKCQNSSGNPGFSLSFSLIRDVIDSTCKGYRFAKVIDSTCKDVSRSIHILETVYSVTRMTGYVDLLNRLTNLRYRIGYNANKFVDDFKNLVERFLLCRSPVL